MLIHLHRFLIPFLLLAVFAAPAAAADGSPLLLGYWSEFTDYWQGAFQKQNGIVVGISIIGALSLFIITRGKWLK